MTPEKKRKLRNIALLSLLGLIGGTMAFQAFNQQAINDRLGENRPGGRVHDYFNRETENKDIFVENFGDVAIMARIRLSEYMEIKRAGETDFTPLVAGTARDDVNSWTRVMSSADDMSHRVGPSAAFNQYANLTFGWTRAGETAPWYMPTFNHDNLDIRKAAAGHARDWIEGMVPQMPAQMGQHTLVMAQTPTGQVGTALITALEHGQEKQSPSMPHKT